MSKETKPKPRKLDLPSHEKRPLPPWESYERSQGYVWPVGPDEQAQHAAFWAEKEGPAIAERLKNQRSR